MHLSSRSEVIRRECKAEADFALVCTHHWYFVHFEYTNSFVGVHLNARKIIVATGLAILCHKGHPKLTSRFMLLVKEYLQWKIDLWLYLPLNDSAKVQFEMPWSSLFFCHHSIHLRRINLTPPIRFLHCFNPFQIPPNHLQ
jgi:hypothetical protein